jgi:hypothetical protein
MVRMEAFSPLTLTSPMSLGQGCAEIPDFGYPRSPVVGIFAQLICEREVEGRTVDLWLIHSEYNDECTYLPKGERIIIRRAAIRERGRDLDQR